MNNGLFIVLYDDDSLSLYLEKGIYGFLMKPSEIPSRNHFAVLADFACSTKTTDVFYFIKRRIVYAGTIDANSLYENNTGCFYLNGNNSLMCRNAEAPLCWDESPRYTPTENKGCFIVQETTKCQPYLLKIKKNDYTGKMISSDDLYFNLGKYPFPLPTNSIQNMGFCVMTPSETSIAMSLIKSSKIEWSKKSKNNIELYGEPKQFNNSLCNTNHQSEAELEFNIIANPQKYLPFLNIEKYYFCRQIPISPFKPSQMDRADICLYDKFELLEDGSIPNIVIELKKDKADYHAYAQVVRYLKWLEKITKEEVFEKITAYIVAPSFKINKNKIDDQYATKIKCWDLSESKFYEIK